MGEELRWLKEMIRRFLFLSAYSSFNDQPLRCLCPALLPALPWDPAAPLPPALIRSDIWGTEVSTAANLSHAGLLAGLCSSCCPWH